MNSPLHTQEIELTQYLQGNDHTFGIEGVMYQKLEHDDGDGPETFDGIVKFVVEVRNGAQIVDTDTATVTILRRRAFPGAEGYACYSRGGRSKDLQVFRVTTLASDSETQPGTLRWALKQTVPRIVVFTVAGTLELQSPLKIDASNSYVTIAGQTSPGGVCVKNYGLEIANARDVVVRYMHFRPGSSVAGTNDIDALYIRESDNVIIDHCTCSWGVDAGLDIGMKSGIKRPKVTVQWCLISQTLRYSKHHEREKDAWNNAVEINGTTYRQYKGHSKATLVEGMYGVAVSFLSNLWAHNVSRIPRLKVLEPAVETTPDVPQNDGDPGGLRVSMVGNVICCARTMSGEERIRAIPTDSMDMQDTIQIHPALSR